MATVTNPLSLKHEPVRLYAVAAAALALVAFYVPDLPVELLLGLIAALLGVAELQLRANVTPEAHIEDLTTGRAFDLYMALATDPADEFPDEYEEGDEGY